MAENPSPGAIQTSDKKQNQLGYNALFQARDGVRRSQTDVKTVMQGLINAYGGSDGQAFQNLLSEWSSQVDVIIRSMEEMMQTLTDTDQAQTRTQAQINDFIAEATRNALSGK